jgi:hypothetical protein
MLEIQDKHVPFQLETGDHVNDLQNPTIGIGRKRTRLQSGRLGNADEKAGTSSTGFGRLKRAKARRIQSLRSKELHKLQKLVANSRKEH